jgi:hypothetical protein
MRETAERISVLNVTLCSSQQRLQPVALHCSYLGAGQSVVPPTLNNTETKCGKESASRLGQFIPEETVW